MSSYRRSGCERIFLIFQISYSCLGLCMYELRLVVCWTWLWSLTTFNQAWNARSFLFIKNIDLVIFSCISRNLCVFFNFLAHWLKISLNFILLLIVNEYWKGGKSGIKNGVKEAGIGECLEAVALKLVVAGRSENGGKI